MTDKSLVYTVEVLDVAKRYSFRELCDISQLTEAVVAEFIDYEVIIADGPTGADFTYTQLDRLMRAFRLQRDLEINTPGVALAIELLESNKHLEQRIKQLEQITLSAQTSVEFTA